MRLSYLPKIILLLYLLILAGTSAHASSHIEHEHDEECQLCLIGHMPIASAPTNPLPNLPIQGFIASCLLQIELGFNAHYSLSIRAPPFS